MHTYTSENPQCYILADPLKERRRQFGGSPQPRNDTEGRSRLCVCVISFHAYIYIRKPTMCGADAFLDFDVRNSINKVDNTN